MRNSGYIAAVLFLSFAVFQVQGDPPSDTHKAAAGKLPLCPVMDEPIDFNVMAATEEGPVYFCCARCIAKYEADKSKYSDQVKAQREMLAKMEKIQVKCPVGGEPIDPKVSKKIGEQTVTFCCEKCAAAYEKEPAKYETKLRACFTYQTICPVGGEKIDPTAFVDLPTGERIYTCCKKCGASLLADPAKYAPKLAEQGINLDLKKLSKKAG